MPVNVRCDYPQPQRVRRLLSRLGSTLAGGLFIFVGLVAALALIPAGFGVIGVIGGASRDELLGVSDAVIVVTFVVLVVVMVAGAGSAADAARKPGARPPAAPLRLTASDAGRDVRSDEDDRALVATRDARRRGGHARGGGERRDGARQGSRAGQAGRSDALRVFKGVVVGAFWAGSRSSSSWSNTTDRSSPSATSSPRSSRAASRRRRSSASLVGAFATIAVILALCLLAAGAAVPLGIVALLLTPVRMAGGSLLAAARAAEEGKLRRVDSAAVAEKVANELEVGAGRSSRRGSWSCASPHRSGS